MSRSGLLNSGWRSFVDVHKDDWYGVNGIGRTGVGHIELARSSFLGRNEPSIAPPLPPAMTLLDYFAGQALVGLVNDPLADGQDIARRTYLVAAAMIAEKRRRERSPADYPDVADAKVRLWPEWEKLPDPKPDFEDWFGRVMAQGE